VDRNGSIHSPTGRSLDPESKKPTRIGTSGDTASAVRIAKRGAARRLTRTEEGSCRRQDEAGRRKNKAEETRPRRRAGDGTPRRTLEAKKAGRRGGRQGRRQGAEGPQDHPGGRGEGRVRERRTMCPAGNRLQGTEHPALLKEFGTRTRCRCPRARRSVGNMRPGRGDHNNQADRAAEEQIWRSPARRGGHPLAQEHRELQAARGKPIGVMATLRKDGCTSFRRTS